MQYGGASSFINAGDVTRISPNGERCFRAAKGIDIKFICIQVKAGSLEQFTHGDGILCESKSAVNLQSPSRRLARCSIKFDILHDKSGIKFGISSQLVHRYFSLPINSGAKFDVLHDKRQR